MYSCFLLLFIAIFVCNFELNQSIKWSFLLNAENWTIRGNKRLVEQPFHQHFNLPNGLNRYIVGYDTLIDTDFMHPDDKRLWYFDSPSFVATITNKSMLKFNLMWFSRGSELNNNVLEQCVKLCETAEYICIDARCIQFGLKIDGEFAVPFTDKWWSRNFQEFSKKYFRKSTEYRLSILGDWTRRNETFGLDNVSID